ncbi:Cytochrome c, mono- and diheme variants [Hahella chejuensis KCTC 2396]|uniref:Cytochrome c, mono-and diheme variants n=2 Tax=Hahella chejuensis TaxID=158327 RepID=Q2SHT4_HAHCH|nr:Cytochrome c, mono- and diheme variants [Hahella chejuensis KCTC 2396]
MTLIMKIVQRRAAYSRFTMAIGLGLTLMLSACTQPQTDTGRWYTKAQAETGKTLFEANCGVCHGRRAQGLAEDWKKPDASGHYPPPPLNGTAHAWHHPMETLLATIENGGAPVGGVMPAFGDKFSQEQKLALIAYFQSLWPDDIYQQWREIDDRN